MMRTILMAALAVASLEVGAQTPVPPVPPVTPAPPALPAPAARPVPPAPPPHAAPPALPAWPRTPGVGDPISGVEIRPLDFDFTFDREWRIEEMERAREAMRIDRDAMHIATEALRSIDHQAIREESIRAMELSRVHMDEARLAAQHDLNFAMLPPPHTHRATSAGTSIVRASASSARRRSNSPRARRGCRRILPIRSIVPAVSC